MKAGLHGSQEDGWRSKPEVSVKSSYLFLLALFKQHWRFAGNGMVESAMECGDGGNALQLNLTRLPFSNFAV